jgi:hypothetical protein
MKLKQFALILSLIGLIIIIISGIYLHTAFKNSEKKLQDINLVTNGKKFDSQLETQQDILKNGKIIGLVGIIISSIGIILGTYVAQKEYRNRLKSKISYVHKKNADNDVGH